jgi:Bcr/CflA subfamily drug resistance transporter
MNTTRPVLSDKRIFFIICSLLSVSPVLGMAIDLVAPSLPAISLHLQVSSGLVKQVITLYMLGYALGNFFTGFLADAFGRHKFLVLGLGGFVVASLLPVFFPNITILLTARTLQGLMMGAVAVSLRAIYSDILPPEKMVRMGTLIGTMFGLGPVIGPVIGGYLQFYFSWQSCFIFFAALVTIELLIIAFVVPETHHHRHPLHLTTLSKNMTEVLRHKKFMGIVLLMGCVYSLLISFHTLAPFLIENQLGYSSVFFGRLALWLGLAFLAGTFMIRALLKKQSVEKLMAIILHLFLGVAFLGLLFSFFARENLWLLGIVSAVMFSCCGMIFPMSMGKGMVYFRHIAGTAAALMYLINIFITVITAFLMGFIHSHSVIPIMAVYCVLLLICVTIYWGLIRNKV